MVWPFKKKQSILSRPVSYYPADAVKVKSKNVGTYDTVTHELWMIAWSNAQGDDKWSKLKRDSLAGTADMAGWTISLKRGL